jgi:glyoxalase family protein
MTILGLHHITLVTRDAQRNVDFYTRVLGLRFIKKTINFDDPSAYHLYYGDQTGSPGTAITFFEWKHALPGRPGIGGTHHFALRVADYDNLLRWKRRLTDLGIPVKGPYNRFYFQSIYFKDPDGTILEIATEGPGWTVDEPAGALGQSDLQPPEELAIANRDEERIRATTWAEPIPEILPSMSLQRGMHHITAIGADIRRSNDYYAGLLGMPLVKRQSNFDDPSSAHWYWGAGDLGPGTILTYFERDPNKEPAVRMGSGQTHHYALAVADEEIQLEWREKLLATGKNVSPVMDRVYFKSIYTRDPDGHIVELATMGPGFLVDEDQTEPGTTLRLPPWLEAQREDIEANLDPITVSSLV